MTYLASLLHGDDENPELREVPPPPLPPLTPNERRAFDYTVLDEAMAHLDAVVRQTRHDLGALLRTGGG